ncbi:glycoside hydrolase family 13 protein [Nakamurella antarctica]|uniref:Glycoside hydrolase family 13 protein n=1 Tax=Nakamurella antarctica TaxID=1902245 RepID=A0A3G8ZK98_9ACTN|nr:glycoside hydrolase family 13 protein [Nakamurella antarctica]AZI57749.1 glycoside hydrolase family 13 protein [Nakamurella antarctica]
MTVPTVDVAEEPNEDATIDQADAIEASVDVLTPLDPADVTPAEWGDWRREAVVYQIYPRSFADSNGDGIGDLPGITSRLAAIADLGVDAIWLSPFYTSPQADAGYDVADFRAVDPIFGDLEDFDRLLATAHDLGLKVIVDLVPNHSSDDHVWFQAALAAPAGSPERDLYHFVDGRGPNGDEPPNNWKSVFGGGAWERTTNPDGTPGQWYLHFFDVRQPDFNWNNPLVREEFLSVLRFWLDRGVDGFRVDVANSLMKAPGLPDSVPGELGVLSGLQPDTAPDAIPHTLVTEARSPMWDQDEVHPIYREWRALLNTYQPARILVAEAWVQPAERLAMYVRPDEMHQAFNFDYLETPWSGTALRSVITATTAANAAVGAPTTWVLSNHDVVRHPSRFGLPNQGKRPNGIGANDVQPDAELGLARARAATMVMLALPGSAYLFQGEELGLPEHTFMPDVVRQDPTFFRTHGVELGRDGCRVPLPWESAEPAYGFGPSDQTWLPQPESFAMLARDRQVGDPGSTLELYRSALRLRREYGVGSGQLSWLSPSSDDVVAFRNGPLTVMCNMGAASVEMPLGTVLLASGAFTEAELDARMLPPNASVWLI